MTAMPWEEEMRDRHDAPAKPGELGAPDAEAAVLGAGILDADAAVRMVELLPDPAMFTDPALRALYRVMRALVARHAPLDDVTIMTEAGVQGTEDAVRLAVVKAIDACPTAANVDFHAAIVRDRYLRRQLVQDAAAVQARAKDLAAPVADTLAGMVDHLVRVVQPELGTVATPAQQFVEVLGRIEQQADQGNTILGQPSGLKDLDELTDGYMPGRLIIAAARPKMGKTAFGLASAENVASLGGAVLFVSGEQPVLQLQARRLATATGCNLREIRSRKMLDDWTGPLRHAAMRLCARPLHFTQTALTPASIRLVVRRLQAEVGRVGLVVVDYLDKLRSDVRKERHDLEVGEITWGLSRLAVDLDVPVLLLAQLNRESVKNGITRRPVVSDLRDSGRIEQDADQVIFLWRKPDDPEWPAHRVELDVALNRHGPTGRVDVAYHRSTGRWEGYWRMEVVP